MFERMERGATYRGRHEVQDVDVESVTNDLVEKSIRNFAVREAWHAAARKN